MKKNVQKKEIKKLKKEKKELEKSLNPFNKNFSLRTCLESFRK
ncbi:hypothetical protein [Spiroplasma endosymbiont of Cleonymus obscurus]